MAYQVLFGNNIEDIVKFLITNRKNIDIIVDDETPLIKAVKEGESSVVDILIDEGCDVNMSNKYGDTALHYCCGDQYDNREMLEKLIAAKADATVRNRNGTTPLHKAAVNTNSVGIIHVLSIWSDMSAQDYWGYTPLMNACAYNGRPNCINIIEKLIYSSDDIDIQNIYGNTALHEACREKNYEAVKLLLGVGADRHITNNYDKTAYECSDNECKTIFDNFFN